MKRHYWTDEELKIVQSDYPIMQTEKLALKLGVTDRAVYMQARLLGLHKDPIYLASPESGRMAKGDTRGLPTRFIKGHEPQNKGKKWNEFMSKEGQENSRKTTFKKGNIPATTIHFGKPYLHHRKRKDGYVEKLWFIQEGTNKRSAYLAYLCRQNGIDLTGKKPILKPGFDHLRPPTLEDIVILSNAENMQRNTIHRYPPELKFAMKKLKQLKRTINEKQDC